MVKLYLIRYHQDGTTKWWAESLSQEEAFTVARKLAMQGFRPVVKRIDVNPHRPVEGAIVRLEIATA
ncbi:MAG: hypothetical protein NTW52_08945 [Planctomycetota bacterium]|nr:hypothetical protein [Planctomycetota bacterium]